MFFLSNPGFALLITYIIGIGVISIAGAVLGLQDGWEEPAQTLPRRLSWALMTTVRGFLLGILFGFFWPILIIAAMIYFPIKCYNSK